MLWAILIVVDTILSIRAIKKVQAKRHENASACTDRWTTITAGRIPALSSLVIYSILCSFDVLTIIDLFVIS